MSVRLFHTADLHLGAEVSYLGARADERRFEMLATFKAAIDYCLNENIGIFLIAGDLFDSNSAALEFAPSVFEYIRSAEGIKFFYVAGNHDPLDAASPMLSRGLPENLYVFSHEYEIKELPELGLRIIGRSFAHSAMENKAFTTALPDDELVNVMLLHADISSDKSSPYNPIDKDFIENSGVDYLALGHIHKRTAPAKLSRTTFAYPGSPESHGFDEEGVRGGYVADISKENCSLSFIRLCRRAHRVEKIDISEATSSISAADIIIEKLSESFGKGYENDLYKIIMTGALAESVTLKTAEILQILKDKLYFVKLRDKTRSAYDLDAIKAEVSLRGIFVKKMLEKIEAADEASLPLLESALYMGLRAFDSEVAYDED